MKKLLAHLQIKNNRDGTYTYDGVKYGELTEVIDIIKASPVFLDAVAAIEILSNFMDASPDAGKPTSLTTPIHEGKPITLVTPIADLDREALVEGFDRAPEGFNTGLTEGFEAYDGLRIISFTKDNVTNAQGIVIYPNNPDAAKGSFKPNIHGTGAKESKIDGTIWEKDKTGHGGKQWKMWLTKRSWECREQPASIWPDGTIRKLGDQKK